MGQRILLSCGKCGLEKTVSVGGGLMSRNPEVIASCLCREEAEEWKRLYDEQKMIRFRSQQKACYCEQCKELKDVLIAEAELTDGNTIVFGTKCSQCQNDLEILELQNDPECPMCHNAKMHQKQIGIWD